VLPSRHAAAAAARPAGAEGDAHLQSAENAAAAGSAAERQQAVWKGRACHRSIEATQVSVEAAQRAAQRAAAARFRRRHRFHRRHMPSYLREEQNNAYRNRRQQSRGSVKNSAR